MSRELKDIGSSTLKVYLLLLEEGNALGVREVQRKIGFKSPSTAKYHLDKLVELGLVEKTHDGLYLAKDSSKPPILYAYVLIYGTLIPRLVPYAVFFTTITLLYIVFGGKDFFALATGFIASFILWIESIRLIRFLKKLKEVKSKGGR